LSKNGVFEVAKTSNMLKRISSGSVGVWRVMSFGFVRESKLDVDEVYDAELKIEACLSGCGVAQLTCN
jgi:hypothetical protein